MAEVAVSQLARIFLKIGAIGFGGPAIIGLMQHEVQERRRWLSRQQFVEALGIVNLLPGPVAAQLAIFIGHSKAGAAGGVIAGLAFMLPGFIIITALAAAYGTLGGQPLLRSALYGAGPVAIGIFAAAVYRLGVAAIKERLHLLICISAALAMLAWQVAIVLLLAGCAGVALFHSLRAGLLAAMVVIAIDVAVRYGWAPLTVAGHSQDMPTLLQLATFFFQVGALTFGGGISILAFLQQAVVGELQWLSPQEFVDGLAIGQLTPGPVLMLAAFVGYKMTGLAGAAVAAVAVFLPSFLMMLAIFPVVRRYGELRWLKAAMKGIAPAVIGVLGISLMQLAWHAATDAIAATLMVGACAAILLWNIGTMKLVAAGALIGIVAG